MLTLRGLGSMLDIKPSHSMRNILQLCLRVRMSQNVFTHPNDANTVVIRLKHDCTNRRRKG